MLYNLGLTEEKTVDAKISRSSLKRNLVAILDLLQFNFSLPSTIGSTFQAVYVLM